jgi:hypothetical protein
MLRLPESARPRASERSHKTLQQLRQFITVYLAILQYLRHQAGPYHLAAMNRHNRTSSIRMPKKVVASLDPNNLKANLTQRGDNLLPCSSREPGHASTQMR